MNELPLLACMFEDRAQLLLSCRHFQINDDYYVGRINHQSLSTNYVAEQGSEGYEKYALLDIQGNLVLSTGIQHHTQV